MKVFISWSGERSRKVAELIDTWLKCVIQAVEPWISSQDLDRGSIWFNDILQELSTCGVGIICLTKENLNKPWILFEAGAIAKGIGVNQNKVCTFLIDLQPSDILDPLAQFNHTLPDKNGVKNLIDTINKSLKERSLKDNILRQVFETYWPEFESEFKKILTTTKEADAVSHSEKGKKTEELKINDLLPELLTTVRNIDRRLFAIEQNKTYNSHSSIPPSNKELLEIKNFIDTLPDNEYVDFEIVKMINERFNVPKIIINKYLKDEISAKSMF